VAELPKAWCFKDVKKVYVIVFLFLAWFVISQVIVECFGVLVSMMEHDLGCSMDTLYE
jgi:hypothetical protein